MASDFDLKVPCLYEVLLEAPLVCGSLEKVSIIIIADKISDKRDLSVL